ncbi:MAG TPA: glucosamine--fructose-6-phosphate aminotransferase [Gammaproteobacteria bacterium]
MIRLPNALRAWGSADFAATLKAELENFAANRLPLNGGATPGSYIADEPVTVTLLQSTETAAGIQTRVGVFFTEIIANCSCGDEPVFQPAYCELRIDIDRITAAAALAFAAA